jgi:hypothetical protein
MDKVQQKKYDGQSKKKHTFTDENNDTAHTR